MEHSPHHSLFRAVDHSTDAVVNAYFLLRMLDSDQVVVLFSDVYNFEYLRRDPISLRRDVSAHEFYLALKSCKWYTGPKSSIDGIGNHLRALGVPFKLSVQFVVTLWNGKLRNDVLDPIIFDAYVPIS